MPSSRSSPSCASIVVGTAPPNSEQGQFTVIGRVFADSMLPLSSVARTIRFTDPEPVALNE